MTDAISAVSSNSKVSMDILYSGEAKAKGVYNFTFPEGKDLSSYKLLCFFTDAYYLPYNKWITKYPQLVEPIVNDSESDQVTSYTLDAETDMWELGFSINDSNHFRIDQILLGNKFSATRIYKVVGIY